MTSPDPSSNADVAGVFKLDTSGIVLPFARYDPKWNAAPCGYQWPDLTPFQQGAVEAALTALNNSRSYMPGDGMTGARELGFSDLAPATLARIMEDCGDRPSAFAPGHDRACGRNYWNGVASGQYAASGTPPLTLYLGDDGLIYLREAAQPPVQQTPDDAPALSTPSSKDSQ